MTDYTCAVCGDRASGRHYGVISCEGCKGFFKRAVRKHQGFRCRNAGQCSLDQKRAKCPSCRYRSCLEAGMRVEAVQQERHRIAEGVSISQSHPNVLTLATIPFPEDIANATDIRNSASSSSESDHSSRRPSGSSGSTSSLGEDTDHNEGLSPLAFSSSGNAQLTMAVLLGGELICDARLPTNESGVTLYADIGENNLLEQICESLENHFHLLMRWAQYLFHFSGPLTPEDHAWLFRAAWPELILLTTSFNSTAASDGLLLSTGRYLSRARARKHAFGPVVDRILNEIVARFREIQLGRVELILLRTIALFNPDAPNLTHRAEVEVIRERLYTGLHAYCMARHGTEASRFTKLMLRLPTVHAIAHKCLEHLTLVKLTAADPSCRQVLNLIEQSIGRIRANHP